MKPKASKCQIKPQLLKFTVAAQSTIQKHATKSIAKFVFPFRFSFVFLRDCLRVQSVFAFLCALCVLCGNKNLVWAENYPSKSIRIVVPYPPGAFNDTLARTLGQKLSEKWKQPVVVDNRPGGGTTLATGMVAQAPADGYTRLMASFAYSVNPALYASLPYDTEKAFVPVILAAEAPNILVVNPSRPYKTVKDLIAAARAKPGALNYASAGNGSSTHLCMELLKSMTGVDMVHVPYKGSVPAVADLMGGQVDVLCDNAPNVLQHIRAGKLRALAVTSKKRAPLVPDLPTVAESGVPGFEVSVWFGIIAPVGTPKAVVQTLNVEIHRILALAEVRQLFNAQGVVAGGGSPESFAAFLGAQATKWKKVVNDSGVKVE